jgi:hypothetical protein
VIRVRSNEGNWRIDDLVEYTATLKDLKASIVAAHPHVVCFEQPLSIDLACSIPLDDNATLSQQ